MKRLLLMMLLIITVSASIPSKKKVLKTSIKELWKTKIGCTSYRTIPVVQDGKIYIGSNGKNFRDALLDEGNGVYILNGKSGAVYKNFDNNQFGDMDVNGILSDPCYVAFTHSGRDNSLMKKEINFEISPGKIYHQQKGDWVKVTPRDFISSLSTRNS